MIKIADTNFNSFIVTNLRPCKGLLVKVPTPIKSSFIDRMFYYHQEQLLIYTDV